MIKKRGQILVENLIFIILNLVFLTILILFLLKQGGGAVILEQSYAKEIALMLDSANPGTLIKLNMEDAKEVADENKIAFDEVVEINKNFVKVRLSEKGGYEYSFFNNADIDYYSSGSYYFFTIDYQNEK